jgi:hypothetical protein
MESIKTAQAMTLLAGSSPSTLILTHNLRRLRKEDLKKFHTIIHNMLIRRVLINIPINTLLNLDTFKMSGLM